MSDRESDDRNLHERASMLFLELRCLPEAERAQALGAAAAEDSTLWREVSSLLEHDSETETERTALPDIPSRIGAYTVIRRLGQGGSGFVLLAEQKQPVQRQVAIKVVPHAAISPDLAARFEFECRALERTEHPNIARILDAGRTVDGLPYLVMDYVEGESITAHCRSHDLALRDRIRLMLDVADAVQHAHQRGVIHRDLKPGNILVTQVSGRAVPRVLDFGIAKPIPERFSAETPATSGMPMGTPAYMAPEQTGGQPIDTRADVYALGAILHELACGRPPLEIDERTADPMDTLRRIRDVVPTPASRVRQQFSVLFRSDPVPRSFLGDLDCILAKTLEKEPARRYGTVAAFAADLRRLLAYQPIEARPPTRRYRVSRFAQRNRVLVASMGIVALSLIVGVVGLALGLVEAERQRREAIDQGDAQREVNRFLADDLLAAASPDDQGQHITALDLLHRASRKVDKRFAGRPLIAGSIHHSLGTAYGALGDFDNAELHLNRAIALRIEAAGPDSVETVHSQIAAASLLGLRQKMVEAESALTPLVARARQILRPEDPALYAALNDLGTIKESLDKGSEAVSLLTEALEGRRRLLGPNDPQVLATVSNLAQAYDRLGQTELSLKMMIEALGIAEAQEEPPRMAILGLSNNIGATLQDLNRDTEAQPYIRRAAELAPELMGPDNPMTLTIQGNLAGLETELGDPVHGAALYEGVAQASNRVLGPDAYGTLTARYGRQNSLWHAGQFEESAQGFASLLPDLERALGDRHWLTIQTRSSLAKSLLDSGRPADALPLAQQASDQFMKLYGPDHPRTRTATEMVKSAAALLGRPASRTNKPDS